MANTTYDELYTSFIRNTHVPNSDLPKTDEGRYTLIQSGISMYNTEVLDGVEISGDDSTEEISVELDHTRLLMLSWCLRKIVITGSHDYKTTLTVPFSKELGKRFVNSQISGGKDLLETVEAQLSRYILLTDTSEEY